MASQNKLGPIPHPPKKPVVGNMLSVDATAPVQDLVRLSKELGPIFWLDMMGTPMVIVSGAALVDELSDEKRFDKAVRGPLRRIRAIAGDGLFTADTKEPNWSKAHNILMTPFGNRAMQSYHPMMVDIAEQLAKKWERLNADEEIDVVHDMTALTLDTIGLCGFDYRFNSFYRRDYHPYVAALVRSLETVMAIRGIPLEGLLAARAQEPDGRRHRLHERHGRRDRRGATQECGGGGRQEGHAGLDGQRRRSLDRRASRRRQHPLPDQHLPDRRPRDHQRHAVLCHLRDAEASEVLRKAYEEVDRVLGPDINIKPTYQQVTQLTYITQILKEALRLWPPAPAFGLMPLQDETIGGQYRLKKGTFVTVLALALHRDPSVWGPTPDAFDPENFSREAEAKRPVNAWKPFGNGQRACIGRGFAMHEAALCLGMILQRFKPVDHTGYQMLLKETLTIKPDGFKIKVRPRTDEDRTHTSVPRAAGPASTPSAPVATVRPRPGHNTPLAVLYGSNLGTAEDIAHRIADLAEVNGFATTLALLDDMVGKLPDSGGVIIVCASYNGRRRTMRRSSSSGPAATCRRMPCESALCGVWPRQQRPGLRPISRSRG